MRIDELKNVEQIVDLSNESSEIISNLEKSRLLNEKHISRLERGLRFLKNAAGMGWSEEKYNDELNNCDF